MIYLSDVRPPFGPRFGAPQKSRTAVWPGAQEKSAAARVSPCCLRACVSHVRHLCCIAHKKKKKKKASDKSSTGSTSTPVFTIFRNSAIAPASPLIRKSTTLRPTLWCSNCSVTKRQQFSCPLGTATLSLKWVNVVPGRWICSLSYRGRIFLTAPTWMSSSRTYEYFSNSFVR